MSLFSSMTVTCPTCDSSFTVDAVGSVNADRRPDLRDEILDNSFQTVTCDTCGDSFRLEPDFNYLDMGRGQWIAGKPVGRRADYEQAEAETQQDFDRSYGPSTGPGAQEIGKALQARLTFGWPAVREKILINESGLDDELVELLKIELLRRLPEITLTSETEMRLVGAGDDTLEIVWINPMTEEVTQSVNVRRELYDEVAGNAEGWAPIAEQLHQGMFVDAQRLYIGA